MRNTICGIPHGIRHEIHIEFKIHADMQVLIHRDGLPFAENEKFTVLYHAHGRLSTEKFKFATSIVHKKYKILWGCVVKSAELW